jgi:hypothetical protein
MYVDQTLIFVIFIIFGIIIFNYWKTQNSRKNENFGFYNEIPNNGVNYKITNTPQGNNDLTNFGKNQLNSGASFGLIPPFGVCNQVQMQEGCQNYPYNNDKADFESLCQREVGHWLNRDDLNQPITGEGWQAGRTRKCENLYS